MTLLTNFRNKVTKGLYHVYRIKIHSLSFLEIMKSKKKQFGQFLIKEKKMLKFHLFHTVLTLQSCTILWNIPANALLSCIDLLHSKSISKDSISGYIKYSVIIADCHSLLCGGCCLTNTVKGLYDSTVLHTCTPTVHLYTNQFYDCTPVH